MSSAFDTATLTGYATAPVDSGTMTTQSFDTTYSAVAPVDSSFYSLTGTGGTTAPEAPAPVAPEAPATTSPDGSTLTAPDGMTSTDPTGTTSPPTADAGSTTTDPTTVQVPDAWDPTVTDPTVALMDTTVMQPPSDTTFTTGTAGFCTTATGTSTFTDPAATTG